VAAPALLLLLGGVAWGIGELRYVNREPAVSPLDGVTLVVRNDAKGEGRFGAPRGGTHRHQGVDLAAPLGHPVRAIRSGRVVRAGAHRGLGRFVQLAHGRDLRSLYAHLGTITVTTGQRLRQGEVIGTVGKTGNARHRWIVPHLHVEVARAGQPVDPATDRVLGATIVGAQASSLIHLAVVAMTPGSPPSSSRAPSPPIRRWPRV